MYIIFAVSAEKPKSPEAKVKVNLSPLTALGVIEVPLWFLLFIFTAVEVLILCVPLLKCTRVLPDASF